MDKDKESLLHIGKSDSDDVVEEFKLPQSRTRRPRARKSAGGDSSGSFISVKCILTFFLITVFLSGILLLAYFLLSLQNAVKSLEGKSGDAYNADEAKAFALKLSTSFNKMRTEFDNRITKLEEKNKKLKERIDKMGNTSQKLKIADPNVLYSQKFISIETSIQQLESGMASTGSDINKLKGTVGTLQKTEISARIMRESLDKRMTTLRIYFYNYTSQVRKQGGILPNPSIIKTNLVPNTDNSVSKEYVSNAINTFAGLTHSEQERNSKMLLLELTNLKTITDSLNTTVGKGVTRLNKEIIVLKNQSLKFQTQFSEISSKLPELVLLLNTTTSMKEKVNTHHKRINEQNKMFQDLGNVSQLPDLIKKVDRHQENLILQEKQIKNLTNLMAHISVRQSIPSTAAAKGVSKATNEPPKTRSIPPVRIVSLSPLSNGVATTANIAKTTQQPVKTSVVNVTASTKEIVNRTITNKFSSSTMTVSPSKTTHKQNSTEDVQVHPSGLPKVSKDEQPSSKVPTTFQSSSKVNNGPVLPVEGGFPLNNDVTTSKPGISFENLQGPAIEPKAKNETEADYKRFESVNTSTPPADTVGSDSETTFVPPVKLSNNVVPRHKMTYTEWLKKNKELKSGKK